MGRLAVATNGDGHLAELDALAVAVGRPELTLRGSLNDFTAGTGPAYLARHLTDVTVERYPDDLDVPAVEPILAYLASMGGEPLTPEQESAARAVVRAGIDADGGFRVRKHTVLIAATR
ncbi:hypothetical protein [Micromonospora sp. NPDC092111]|uniref:hypothetical protein n=1 Tax=Micromonospora sp. NPDC092111 TaxID=3364289 RepID=UPI00380EBE8B